MDKLLIRGGRPLKGEVTISGAKNAALTLIPCALLTEEPLTLRNLPRLAEAMSSGTFTCTVQSLAAVRVQFSVTTWSLPSASYTFCARPSNSACAASVPVSMMYA